MDPEEMVSEENIVYYTNRFQPLSENIREIVVERVENASITEVLNIDVREIDGRIQVSVWATEIDSQDDFYDEWHSEFYTISDLDITVEVDIQ